MPDITMCSGAGCSMKEQCYRFKAIPNPYRQSYFMTPPFVDNECNSFTTDSTEYELVSLVLPEHLLSGFDKTLLSNEIILAVREGFDHIYSMLDDTLDDKFAAFVDSLVIEDLHEGKSDIALDVYVPKWLTSKMKIHADAFNFDFKQFFVFTMVVGNTKLISMGI